MTQQDKDLLLKDLCARLPYGVMVSVQGGEFDSYKYPYQLTAVSKFGLDSFCKVYHSIYTPFGVVPNVEDIKPYLRPMSSMTDEEKEEYDSIQCDFGIVRVDRVDEIVEFLLSHHFDFVRTNDGLTMIEAGLALEAPERMYNIKEK